MIIVNTTNYDINVTGVYSLTERFFLNNNTLSSVMIRLPQTDYVAIMCATGFIRYNIKNGSFSLKKYNYNFVFE
jgi:hypothetical protein